MFHFHTFINVFICVVPSFIFIQIQCWARNLSLLLRPTTGSITKITKSCTHHGQFIYIPRLLVQCCNIIHWRSTPWFCPPSLDSWELGWYLRYSSVCLFSHPFLLYVLHNISLFLLYALHILIQKIHLVQGVLSSQALEVRDMRFAVVHNLLASIQHEPTINEHHASRPCHHGQRRPPASTIVIIIVIIINNVVVPKTDEWWQAWSTGGHIRSVPLKIPSCTWSSSGRGDGVDCILGITWTGI